MTSYILKPSCFPCAGYVLLSIFNGLLIIILGVIDEEGTKITLPQQSAYSNSPPPHTVPTYPPRG